METGSQVTEVSLKRTRRSPCYPSEEQREIKSQHGHETAHYSSDEDNIRSAKIAASRFIN